MMKFVTVRQFDFHFWSHFALTFSSKPIETLKSSSSSSFFVWLIILTTIFELAAYLLSKFSEAKSCKVAHHWAVQNAKKQNGEVKCKLRRSRKKKMKMNYCCSIFNFEGADKFSFFFALKNWRVGFKMNGNKIEMIFCVCARQKRSHRAFSCKCKMIWHFDFFSWNWKQNKSAEQSRQSLTSWFLIQVFCFWFSLLHYHNF